MSQFSSEQQLRSIRVDKELLRRIEQYCESELVRLSGIPPSGFARVYSVSLTDSVGTEVFRRISDHRPVQLPDSVQRVVVSFDSDRYFESKKAARIDVRISFSRERLFTALSASADGDNSRDMVAGICDAVLRLMEPHWTNNRLFHPGPGMVVLLFVIGLVTTMLTPSAFSMGFVSLGTGLLVVTLCLGSYAFAAIVLKPWASFDTRADRANEEWWRWLKYGTLGFVLFGTIFTLFRNRLLGF